MRRPNKLNLYIAVFAIASILVVGALSLKGSVVPYVGVREAMRSGRTVQVRGKIEGGSARFDPRTGKIQFTLIDEKGMRMEVSYRGAMPTGYKEADFIVVLGKFMGKTFEAKRILVKCPSKYRMIGPGHK